MADTSIEWTNKTWNPVVGCSIVSPGCTNCYAMQQALRIERMGLAVARRTHGDAAEGLIEAGLLANGHLRYRGTAKKVNGRAVWTGKVVVDPQALDMPRTWATPCLVFVNSMSDLFHEDVPLDFVRDVLRVASETPHHTYQILTKRAERLAAVAPELRFPSNVWMGVSVERADYLGRVEALRTVPAAVRFVSAEPLLGPLDGIDLSGIDWVIAGGESGPSPRPMDPDWARSLRDLCAARGVPFFFKQWGGRNKKAAGRLLDGRTWDEMPGQLRLGGLFVAAE